ncbi:hypothetical protein SAMN05192579_10434 [Rhodanobacter glycinis]|uniref:Antitoxin Xre/MbcA/ParS-like toxin-binding domain-containing protein n=1 Tax=Rhodanobacter glycinis TaxID=582702 RepID=A0A1I4AMC0_9GAMM|nr:hypothetical protein SAMN05192579_10434 [Rhodanobacter glycinis]
MDSGIIRCIVTLAERLEPDRQAVWNWLFNTKIESLDHHAAIELAFTGQGEKVVTMLETALHDETAGRATA